MCEFIFGVESPGDGDEMLLVFNEAERRINKQFPENVAWKLVIAVQGLYEGFGRETMLYKVRIIKANEPFYITPFPVRKTRLVAPKNLALVVSVICYFFVARCEPEQGGDVPHCDLAVRFIDAIRKRTAMLEKIVSEYAEDRDMLQTATD
jgi:hypothetical protein